MMKKQDNVLQLTSENALSILQYMKSYAVGIIPSGNIADSTELSVLKSLLTLQYKPGWEFRFTYDGGPTLSMLMMFSTTDATGKEQHPIKLKMQSDIYAYWLCDQQALHHKIMSAVIEFETHEVQEWLKIDGQHIRPPHH